MLRAMYTIGNFNCEYKKKPFIVKYFLEKQTYVVILNAIQVNHIKINRY